MLAAAESAMTNDLQHFLVLFLVAACGGLMAWQFVQTLIGRKSKLGSCCAKGCDPAPAKPQAEMKTQFFPLENLSRRK